MDSPPPPLRPAPPRPVHPRPGPVRASTAIGQMHDKLEQKKLYPWRRDYLFGAQLTPLRGTTDRNERQKTATREQKHEPILRKQRHELRSSLRVNSAHSPLPPGTKTGPSAGRP